MSMQMSLVESELDCNNDISEKVEVEELQIEDPSLTKKRKRNFKSTVWNDFVLIKKNGKEKAKCKNCGIEYSYDSRKGGTSTLQRHVNKCLRLGKRDGGLLLLSQMSGNDGNKDTSEKAELEEPKIEDSSRKKRRRSLKSSVWSDFDLIKKNGADKAKCKHCGMEYSHDSKRSGTSTLQRHLQKCLRLGTRDVGHLVISPVSWNNNITASVGKLDQSVFREKVATAIVKHKYPFNIVEHEGFRDICSYLNVDVKHISSDIAKADIFELHRKQKELIRKRLLSAPGKICLTLDLWASVATDGYMCLTAVFIDHDWVLQKMVLNFCHVPPGHSDHVIANKVFSMLGDWGIEEKIFSFTMDKAIGNDNCVEAMKDQLSLKDALYSSGVYLYLHCCAHVLNLIVEEGLKIVDVAVEKIRESVKYLKGSQVRKAKFLDIVAELALTQKRGLYQDVPTRWNSTFFMLDSCIAYQKVFTHLKLVDENYQHFPTTEEWEQLTAVSKILKAFYEVTNLFSGGKYPTSNVYFQGMWKIQMILKKEFNSSNEFIRLMGETIQMKFDKYWSDFSPILAVAVVLDPRRKLFFVEFCYQKLYPGTYGLEVENVRNKMDLLYREYSSCKSKESTSNTVADIGSLGEGNSTFDEDEIGEDLQEFASFQSTDRQANMSELDFYMLEPRLPIHQDLDILHFWKAQEYRYPNLSRMARDVLTIPLSAVASESAFNNGGRVFDRYRSSLTPEIVEALVTTRDWLYGVGVDYLEVKDDKILEDILGVENPPSSSIGSPNIPGYSFLP